MNILAQLAQNIQLCDADALRPSVSLIKRKNRSRRVDALLVVHPFEKFPNPLVNCTT